MISVKLSKKKNCMINPLILCSIGNTSSSWGGSGHVSLGKFENLRLSGGFWWILELFSKTRSKKVFRTKCYTKMKVISKGPKVISECYKNQTILFPAIDISITHGIDQASSPNLLTSWWGWTGPIVFLAFLAPVPLPMTYSSIYPESFWWVEEYGWMP